MRMRSGRWKFDHVSFVTFIVAAMAALAVLATTAACRGASGIRGTQPDAISVPSGPELAVAIKALQRQVADLEARNKKLLAKVSRFSPQGTYIVVDTGANRLYVMQGRQVQREAVISTGSGFRLVDQAGRRVWIFNTPRGEFEVQHKIVNPVWTKPDWAFIEDGEPIPTKFADRLDPDVLGDYALAIGDGYLIHGSLYKRTLGMSVTHGCIRVGDDDLEAIFKTAPIGTRVYII